MDIGFYMKLDADLVADLKVKAAKDRTTMKKILTKLISDYVNK
jgi:hypothetical protein